MNYSSVDITVQRIRTYLINALEECENNDVVKEHLQDKIEEFVKEIDKEINKLTMKKL